jgi:4-amino-4-deoxy-L-arabinose transferase-like glycosyltransferase
VIDIILPAALAAACLLVTLFYGIGSPWWRSTTGQSLLAMLASMTLVTVLTVLARLGIYGNAYGRTAIVLMTCAVLGVGLNMAVLQYEGRKRNRRQRRRAPRED